MLQKKGVPRKGRGGGGVPSKKGGSKPGGNYVVGETLGETSHDQQFLKLMDQETIKVNGRYIVPLLLKSTDVNLIMCFYHVTDVFQN